ncbi:hypothetical protein VR46_41990 [Streptomyces sp. NRRL S-444]|nr:hypothetical protein VR46_41990 [Streptomyces sp. NRRL S-444]
MPAAEPGPATDRDPEPAAVLTAVRAPAPEVRQAAAPMPVRLRTEQALPARSGPGDGARPPLPERVPQTHLTRQLRGPRAPEPDAGRDAATPEEVADAWADYEEGTRTVEAELRQDQP